MKKMIRNILILASFIFLCNVGNVDAAKVCQYKTPSSVAEDQQISFSCNINDDGTTRCVLNKNGLEYTESILNWNNNNWNAYGVDAYTNINSCPEYLGVLDFRADPSNYNYIIFGGNNFNAMEDIYNAQWPTIPRVIVRLIDPNASDIEQKLADIKNSVEQLRIDYDVRKCPIYQGGDNKYIVTNTCIPKVEEILTTLENYRSELSRMMYNGELAGYTALQQQITTQINETVAYFTEEKELLQGAIDRGKNDEAVWRLYTGNYVKPPVENPDENPDGSQCQLFGPSVDPIIKWIIRFIYMFVSVFIIVASIIDFVGVALSGEEKNFKAAGTKLVKRLMIGVIIIFLPILITFIIDLSGVLVPYGIESNEIFCALF